jgi:hypothetical protein
MSDILEATSDSLELMVDGTLRKFCIITAYGRAQLLRDDLKRRQTEFKDAKARQVENLKIIEATSQQMMAELEQFDKKYPTEVTEENWWDFVNNLTNDPVLYQASLSITYPDEAEALSKKATLTIAEKAKICGLSVVIKPSGEANPQTPESIPPTYSTPATNSTGDTPSQESSTIAA